MVDDDIKILNLEYVVRELDLAMNDARFVCKHKEYTGMVRNDIIETLSKYMNTLQNKYTFQYPYELKYKQHE